MWGQMGLAWTTDYINVTRNTETITEKDYPSTIQTHDTREGSQFMLTHANHTQTRCGGVSSVSIINGGPNTRSAVVGICTIN